MMTEAEISGYMGWRGPGAYTAVAMRKIKAIVAETIRREREECADLCDDMALYTGLDCAEKIRGR